MDTVKTFKSNNRTEAIRYVLTAALLISAATGIGWLFHKVGFPETNIVLVYLLSILLTARLTRGFAYGIAAALAATCAFNYFFTQPYFTLRVYDPDYYITFLVMTVTAVITSALTSRVKQSALERMKSQEEAMQERYRGNLLRAISHDLRTPLSGIMGTSEMLMDMSEKDDRRYALAEGIHRDADWLHSLVENILGLTRLQDGKLPLDKQTEAVEEVIGSAVGHITERSPEHEIIVNIPDEPLFVPMDAKLIVQALVNLLDNAVRHTPPREEITVSVTGDGEKTRAVFSVADRGSGIAAEDLPKIFEMFYTTHGREADARRGVGLGLAICEAIITAHGGTIEAHNRTDGPGAEFIFTLPMEVQENAENE